MYFGSRTYYLLGRELREDILQRIITGILDSDGSSLILTAYLQVACIVSIRSYTLLGWYRSDTANQERMLITILIGQGNGTAEVAVLGRSKRHWQRTGRAGCNIIGTL